jgi:hypothetical protein
MQYLAMFAVMAMLGATTGGTAAMAAGFGHGAPDDVQARNEWTGPAGFGNGQCTGPCDGDGNQYRYGAGTADGAIGPTGYGDQQMADDDGDGIPNGQDPDWVPPQDGTGYQHEHGKP